MQRWITVIALVAILFLAATPAHAFHHHYRGCGYGGCGYGGCGYGGCGYGYGGWGYGGWYGGYSFGGYGWGGGWGFGFSPDSVVFFAGARLPWGLWRVCVCSRC